jgi:hypothetical protein
MFSMAGKVPGAATLMREQHSLPAGDITSSTVPSTGTAGTVPPVTT